MLETRLCRRKTNDAKKENMDAGVYVCVEGLHGMTD